VLVGHGAHSAIAGRRMRFRSGTGEAGTGATGSPPSSLRLM
jgi:hypothetical protein